MFACWHIHIYSWRPTDRINEAWRIKYVILVSNKILIFSLFVGCLIVKVQLLEHFNGTLWLAEELTNEICNLIPTTISMSCCTFNLPLRLVHAFTNDIIELLERLSKVSNGPSHYWCNYPHAILRVATDHSEFIIKFKDYCNRLIIKHSIIVPRNFSTFFISWDNRFCKVNGGSFHEIFWEIFYYYKEVSLLIKLCLFWCHQTKFYVLFCFWKPLYVPKKKEKRKRSDSLYMTKAPLQKNIQKKIKVTNINPAIKKFD